MFFQILVLEIIPQTRFLKLKYCSWWIDLKWNPLYLKPALLPSWLCTHGTLLILRRIKMLALELSFPLLGYYGSSQYNVMWLLELWQEIVNAWVPLWAQSFDEICSSISWKLWLFNSNWACTAGFLLTGDILIHVQFITAHIFPPFNNFLTALIQGTSIMCIELKDAKSVCWDPSSIYYCVFVKFVNIPIP